MNSNQSNKAKEIITHLKSIPISLYMLIFLNFALFVGLVCRQLSLIYIFGAFLFVCLILAVGGKATNLLQIPEEIVSQNVHYRLKELEHKVESFFERINISKLESGSTNTILTILFLIYVSTILNDTIQIFLVFNFVYFLVFLPQQTEGCMGVVQQNLDNLLRKIKYNA